MTPDELFEWEEMKRRITALEGKVNPLDEAGLDRLRESGLLQFDGIPMRWDTNGMQVATGSSDTAAIYFVNTLTPNPSAASPYAKLQGFNAGGTSYLQLLAGGTVQAGLSVVNSGTTDAYLYTAGQVHLRGVLTPAQITADQDNYQPNGIRSSSVLRLSTDASRNITGLNLPAGDGALMVIHNIGSFNIVLKDESLSSTAQWRFALAGDITIAPDETALLRYDNTSERWRCVGVYTPASYATASSITDHTGDTSDAHDASAISVADAGGLLAATDVEAALAELQVVYNVKSYGALGDNSTNDTTAIQSAIDAANTAGGGIVFFPEGTYLSGTLTLYSNIHMIGCGPTATTLKLRNSTNAALIQGSNFVSLSAGDTTGGIADWSVQQMTLDGNKANNGTTGYGIRVYGYRYVLRDLHIKDFFTNGIYSQWASASSENMEARLDNVRVYSSATANGDGSGSNVYWLGPHDSVFTGCFFFYGDSKGFESGHVDKAAGLLFMNCHAYGNDQTYGFHITGDGCAFVGCVAEGAATANVHFASSNCRWMDGYIFAASAASPVGLEIANNVSGYYVTGLIVNCTSGAVKLAGTDGGNGLLDVTCYQTSGSALSGTAAATTDYRVRVDGGGTGSGNAFTDPFLRKIEMKGANIEMQSSDGTLQAYLQASDGAIVWGASSDVNLYRGDANFLQTDDQFYAGDGVRMKTKAGVPSDSDTTVDADGVIILDTTNSRLYIRSGGTWKYAALT